MYELDPSPKFQRLYQALPDKIKKTAEKQLALPMADPRHPSLRTKKREGGENLWQCRVTLNYRIYFEWEGMIIRLKYIGPHE